MLRTRLSDRQSRTALTLAERDTSRPFRVVPDVDPAVYDDPAFVLTITIETVDPVTGRRRGMVSRHTGRPMGKSGRWAAGMMTPPEGLRSRITIETSKAALLGADLEEADAPATRSGPGEQAYDKQGNPIMPRLGVTLDGTQGPVRKAVIGLNKRIRIGIRGITE